MFAPGKYYSEKHHYKTPMVILNNWIIGNDAKKKRAQRWGHWYLSDDGKCKKQQNTVTGVVQSNIDLHSRPRKRALVTGVAGYIGSHMALKLLRNGFTIFGVDNLSRGSLHALSVLRKTANFHFLNIDLGDTNAVERIFSKHSFHYVFHFASLAFVTESVRLPDLYFNNITKNTRILVDAMLRHEVPRLIYSSTCAVYGNPDKLPITEETPKNPVSPYGSAKLEAEKYIAGKVSTTFQADVLRYFNVIGASSQGILGENPKRSLIQYARIWTACLEVVRNRAPCVRVKGSKLPTPDGSSVRDYVHVDDVVDAHLAVINISGRDYFESWNVATNTPTSTLEFIQIARNVTNHPIPTCIEDVVDLSSPYALYASSDRLWRRGKWKARYSDLRVALTTAWAWDNQKKTQG
jgi:UDP-arabinose 4-epimerase